MTCLLSRFIWWIQVSSAVWRSWLLLPLAKVTGTSITSKSMKKFKELFPEKVRLRIRFSLDNLKLDDDVLNIPLFMAEQTDRLIGVALAQLQK